MVFVLFVHWLPRASWNPTATGHVRVLPRVGGAVELVSWRDKIYFCAHSRNLSAEYTSVHHDEVLLLLLLLALFQVIFGVELVRERRQGHSQLTEGDGSEAELRVGGVRDGLAGAVGPQPTAKSTQSTSALICILHIWASITQPSRTRIKADRTV